MKILYVITSTDRGGAEQALAALARAARQAGHTVKIISLREIGSVGKQLQCDQMDVLSFEVKGTCRPLETLGAWARLIQEIQAFQPDVVHALLFRAIELCRLAKRRISFRLVTTPHYDWARRRFWLRLGDRVLKEADDISGAESRQTAEFLRQKQHYSDEKLRLVPNGVNAAFFAPDKALRAAQRQKMGFLEEQTVFVCVARLAKEKNHRLLLQAFLPVYAKHPQARLVLVGDGPEKENCMLFVREKRLEKAVVFVGEVADVKPYLAAADVFVLPSLTESLPLALLEACACGLPALVSRVGDMPDVVAHGQTGFVCNTQDPVLLSALMAELLENKALRAQMGRAARHRVEQRYPPPEEAYLQIYQEIQ